MAEGTDNIKKELKSLGEETAAIFQEALTSIAASFGEKLREETDTLDSAQKALLRNFKNNISSAAGAASSLVDIQSKLRDGSIKENDLAKAKASIESRINKLSVTSISLKKAEVKLTDDQIQREEDAFIFLRKQKNEIQNLVNLQDEVTKELGATGTALGVIDKLFKSIGINNPFGEALELTKASRASIKLAEQELEQLQDKDSIRGKELNDQILESTKTIDLVKNIGNELKETFSANNLLLAAGTAIAQKLVQQFFKLNELQVNSRRNTGELVDRTSQFNTSLVLTTDYLEQVNSLTEQFGFNTTKAFDAINIEEAATLTKMLGLAANESGALALNAQISGENLKDGADQAVRAINPAFSQRKILQDIAKLSASIAISFENSNVALAKAASDAKELGLNLSQVDKIAGSLLDIESSIAKEFEAEVISGRQLNLERARYFALTNDLAGVTKELTKQGITQESFAAGTRIEQEAIAGAIGLGREELAASLQEQALLANMSEQDIKRKERADLQALTVQQSLSDSMAKLADFVAAPLALIASIVDSGPIMIGVFSTLAALLLKSAISAGITATSILSATQPFLIPLLIGSIAGITAAIVNSTADDMISPNGYGERILTGPEGSIALNNNDTVIAGTNLGGGLPSLARENTRNNNTQLDYEKLANAIAMGAEKGTSRANVTTNLDGAKVSNRIQAPLAMSTRKYSV